MDCVAELVNYLVCLVVHDTFFCVFLNHDEGAIFTNESGAVLAYLQMQIGITLYLQAVFFCVHKRNTISKNKTTIWHHDVAVCYVESFTS